MGAPLLLVLPAQPPGPARSPPVHVEMRRSARLPFTMFSDLYYKIRYLSQARQVSVKGGRDAWLPSPRPLRLLSLAGPVPSLCTLPDTSPLRTRTHTPGGRVTLGLAGLLSTGHRCASLRPWPPAAAPARFIPPTRRPQRRRALSANAHWFPVRLCKQRRAQSPCPSLRSFAGAAAEQAGPQTLGRGVTAAGWAPGWEACSFISSKT